MRGDQIYIFKRSLPTTAENRFSGTRGKTGETSREAIATVPTRDDALIVRVVTEKLVTSTQIQDVF